MKFCEFFLKDYQTLIEVNYFSAIPHQNGKASRQDLLFQANLLNPKFKLHLGKYLKKNIWCPNCRTFIHSFEEKETDVRISTRMINDVVQNRCDITILLSADSDLIPPIELIKSIEPNHKVFVYFPPKRTSYNLKQICDRYKNLEGAGAAFRKAMLPESIKLKEGFIASRPLGWK